MTQVPDTLWYTAPFDEFDGDERAALLAACEHLAFAAGQTIYEPGSASDGAYILVEGRAELSDPLMATVGGAPVTVEMPGTLVSKGSLLEGFDHRHRFSAMTDATLLFLAREAFLSRFEAGDRFALQLLDFLVVSGSAEVRELNDAIHSLISEA